MAFQWWTTIAVALVAPPGLLPRRSAHFWGSPAPYERVRFPSSGLRLASRRTSRPSRHTSQRPPPRRSARAAARGRPQPADTRRHSAHSALLMADAGGAGNSPDGEEYESCFDLMKNNAIEVKKGGRGERACPNCWTAWERGSSTCGNCTIKKLPARTSRRGKQVEFEAKQQPSKADVDAAARAKRPRPPRERRNCSQCQKSCVKAQMKEDWDEPADERWCDVCWKNERRVLTTEPVRLNEVVYIKSGSDYSTSVEVPNATDGLRCKVVVDVTLEIVKDEPEDAKQERARAKVSRFMGNNYGSCHGKVVNVVDGERLGEYATRVSVKRDNENDLYVEKRKVEEALAKTQNGTRPPPKKDWGPFRRDGDCYYLGHARELFSEERYKLVLARELDQFPKQEDADSDDGDEDEDEDDDESESESPTAARAAAICCSMIRLGASLRCLRSASVRPPRPIEVKKLMAKRVSRGFSRGKRPAKTSDMYWSLNRSRSVARPRCSASSWQRILTKIRDDDVVSSSLSRTYSRHVQGSASVSSRCAKNLATFRSLFVSRRWIIAYCSSNALSNASCQALVMTQNRCPSRP
mmetsp:Transcript_18128/g.53974  ORF Transcript_18128/g.53974 Transcript_18128/m.53974 type:complete len:581 (+) Transcript_18128:14-1756(+)